MKRAADAIETPPLAAEQIELALAHVEGSAAFQSSRRHRALLRHVVAQVLHGDAGALKETVIAVEVFGRSSSRFDPKLDSIVRVETRRLRARLARYYAGEGAAANLRFELPVGSYVPMIRHVARPRSAATATRRARDLVERGEHFLRQPLAKDTLEQALARFDEALRETPDHAPALVGLARAWLNLGSAWYHEPAVASAHAAEALRRALALDAQQAEAWVLMGALQHQYEHDWTAAQRSFKRAVAMAPQLAFAHSGYGAHLFMHGDFAAAALELTLARELDPQYINCRNHMVNLRIAQGRLVDAEAELSAMQDIAPPTVSLVGLRGVLAMCRGDAVTAIAHYERARELMPDHPGCWLALAAAHAMAGHDAVADALIAQLPQRFPGRPISAYGWAIFETRRGRHHRAFAALERAVSECDPYAIQIPCDPSFAALHGDARWAILLTAKAFKTHGLRALADAGLKAPPES